MGCALDFLFQPRAEVLDLVRDNFMALSDPQALKIGIHVRFLEVQTENSKKTCTFLQRCYFYTARASWMPAPKSASARVPGQNRWDIVARDSMPLSIIRIISGLEEQIPIAPLEGGQCRTHRSQR